MIITTDNQDTFREADIGLVSNGAVTSFNDRQGAVVLTADDVTAALGYIPSTGGDVTVDISDVNGLQGELDSKQPAGSYANAIHTHVIADVTGLQGALDTKAASNHTHIIGDVTGLQSALDAKQAAGTYATGTGTATGTNTGDQTTISGNAGTATKLLTARNINGVAFDGTTNITINAVDSTARVPTSTTISTTAPLAGGGNLATNRTLSITAATTAAAGSMSAADKTKLDAITGTHTGTNTGDETSGTILSKLSAASGGGTTNFLRADGTWAAPPGGGGGLTDGDKGDVVVGASGTTLTVESATPAGGVFNVTGAFRTTTAAGALQVSAIGAAGTFNTYIGDPAFVAPLTTGSLNVSIGSGAGAQLTTGISNILVGTNAGYAISTAGSNTMIGSGAGKGSTGANGNENVAVGFGALTEFSTGQRNSALGAYSLGTQTTSGSNSAVGWAAGFEMTTGNNNVFVGANAGRGITTGSGNTILGSEADGWATGLTNNFVVKTGAGVILQDNGTVLASTHDITVPDEVYGSGWNSSLEVPTKNAVYDKIETVASSIIPSTRTISTTAPLTGGGDLSANRTLAISAATTVAAGSMSAADKTKLDGIATGATANTGTVTAVSVASANGITGSSSGGATPALTITLGAITPSSVAASGTVTGSNLSGTNTGDETKTTIDTKLTLPSDNTKFYRGDGVWAIPPGGGTGISNGDYGDVVVSAGGTILTVESATSTLNTKAGIRDTGNTLTRFENTGGLAPTGAAGPGLEIIGNVGKIYSYDRTLGSFTPAAFLGSTVTFGVGFTDKVVISSTGVSSVDPVTVPDEAATASWDAALTVPTKNAVYDAIKASVAPYRTIIEPSGSHTAARVAGTYGFSHGQPLAISGTGTLYPLDVVYIDPADYPAVMGLTAKLRVRCTLAANDVAPTGNYVVGLHPVTRPATSGAAGLDIYTIGAAVSGSTLTFTAPAADSINNGVGADFAVPTAGHYIIGMVSSAAVAASSHLHFSAMLQLHHT